MVCVSSREHNGIVERQVYIMHSMAQTVAQTVAQTMAQTIAKTLAKTIAKTINSICSSEKPLVVHVRVLSLN